MFVKEITKWNSNDLMDKIETAEADEPQSRHKIITDALQSSQAIYVSSAWDDDDDAWGLFFLDASFITKKPLVSASFFPFTWILFGDRRLC